MRVRPAFVGADIGTSEVDLALTSSPSLAVYGDRANAPMQRRCMKLAGDFPIPAFRQRIANLLTLASRIS